MRTSEDLEQQLSDLRRIIDKANRIGARDFGSRLQMESLYAEEAQLVNKLKAALLLSENTVVQIALTGNPIIEHAVDIRFLGAFLLHFQEFLNAMGQATTGAATHFGLVRKGIQRGNRLFATRTMHTSFGINFALYDDLSPQQSLLHATENPRDRLPDAVASLPDFFNGDAPLNQLAEIVSFPRVRKHYAAIIKLLAKSNARLELRTRSNPLAVYLTPSQAKQRHDWIERIQNDVRSLDVTGKLNGANIRLRTFEIESDEGTLYHGETTEYATYMLRQIPPGSRIRANILETTERHGDVQVNFRQTYMLRLIDIYTE